MSLKGSRLLISTSFVNMTIENSRPGLVRVLGTPFASSPWSTRFVEQMSVNHPGRRGRHFYDLYCSWIYVLVRAATSSAVT
jgi:hypothetical protein